MGVIIEKTVYSTGSNSLSTTKNLILNFLLDLTTNSKLPCTGWTLDGETFTKIDNLSSYITTTINAMTGNTTLNFYFSFFYNYIIRIYINIESGGSHRYLKMRLQHYKVIVDNNTATLDNSSALSTDVQGYLGDIYSTSASLKYSVLKNNELFVICINSVDGTYAVGGLYCVHDDLYKLVSVHSSTTSDVPTSINGIWRHHRYYSSVDYTNTYDTTYTPFFYLLGNLTSIRFQNRSPFTYSMLHENQIQTIKDKKMINNTNNTVLVTLNTVYDTTKVTPNKVIQIDEKTFYTLDYYTIIDISENA